ncbi:hypothetical protein [Aliamphritea spongicola]|nr:hypothetical protein [Aliamphritea spongicola]
MFSRLTGRGVAGASQPLVPVNQVLPFDAWLLAAALSLMLIGFVMISSASIEVASVKMITPSFI